VKPARELFAQVASFGNLWSAAHKAALGKRARPDVAAFLCDLERQVLRLEGELKSGTWRPAGYHTFTIYEPKQRVICSAPFADRVVHQALVQVVEPVFERVFIGDSYACRLGKGTHAAIDKVAAWARRYPWVLKLDVEKYFPSVDHEVCLAQLTRRVACERTLDLFACILASWSSDEAPRRWFAGDDLFAPARRRRGLPIGNLTSQFLANVVLDAVDHAMKDAMGLRAYARYSDDLVVFGDSPTGLQAVLAQVRATLAGLRLCAHPRKTHVFPTQAGVPWLGFVVFPDRTDLRPAAVPRLRRRLRRFASGSVAESRVRSSLVAIRGHVARSTLGRALAAGAC
jgi:retron-type reverse transcriptase